MRDTPDQSCLSEEIDIFPQNRIIEEEINEIFAKTAYDNGMEIYEEAN